MTPLLLVEDEDMLRSLLKEMLLHKGYSVSAVGGGSSAIDLVEAGLCPRLLITDVAMPGMNGDALAQLLRQKIPDLKVIFISGNTGQSLEAIQDSLAAKDVDFLQKPFRMNVLAEKIAALLSL